MDPHSVGSSLQQQTSEVTERRFKSHDSEACCEETDSFLHESEQILLFKFILSSKFTHTDQR